MALIIPEIYSSLVREKMLGRVKMLSLCTNLGMLKNTTQGDSVIFPKFKLISDCQEVVKGKMSPIDALDQTSSKATIKMIDKIVRVFDIDDITMLGNSIEEASKQQAIVFARKLDSDLITEALTSPLKFACASAKSITADELNNSINIFGDEQDSEEFSRGGIVVHSLLVPSLMQMAEFVDKNKTYNADMNGVVRNGLIGYFRNIPVFVSDKGTYDTAKNECITLIVKNDSLAYMEKTGIDIVEEREEKLHASDIVGSYIYAVKLINDAGVVVVRKTIA